MVVLKDLFDLLATGEFSNLTLAHSPTGGLDEKEHEKVVGHINLGILEIYKRFKLLQNELVLHITPGLDKYYLRPEKVAAVQHMGQRMYIERSEDPDWSLNIIEIIGVFDSLGTEIIINNRFMSPSIVQLAPDVLKITKIETYQTLDIIYQSCPTKIVVDDSFNPEEFVIYIPETIIEPLLYYVAARTYKPMGANDSSENSDKSASYEQKYELACLKFDLYGLSPQHDDKEDTFTKDGWA